MENETRIITVQKADIQLFEGESLGDFTRAVGSAAVDHMKEKLGDHEQYGWSEFVAADYIVVAIFTNENDAKEGMYKLSYSRNSEGEFSFGDYQEVARRITFVPVEESITIAKSEEKIVVEKTKRFWDGVL